MPNLGTGPKHVHSPADHQKHRATMEKILRNYEVRRGINDTRAFAEDILSLPAADAGEEAWDEVCCEYLERTKPAGE